MNYTDKFSLFVVNVIIKVQGMLKRPVINVMPETKVIMNNNNVNIS